MTGLGARPMGYVDNCLVFVVSDQKRWLAEREARGTHDPLLLQVSQQELVDRVRRGPFAK